MADKPWRKGAMLMRKHDQSSCLYVFDRWSHSVQGGWYSKHSPNELKLAEDFIPVPRELTEAFTQSPAQESKAKKEAVKMATLKINLEEVAYTQLNGVNVDNYSDDDLMAFIGKGYEEVKRLQELATAAKSEALHAEADNMTNKVIQIGRILDTRAKVRLAKEEV